MTAKQHNVSRLSNAQLLLLNMFEHDLSENDLEKLRRNLASFLNSKLQEELDSVIKIEKMTRRDINKDEIGHNRTEYLTKIRAEK
jgi:CRISPR/Cas system-associated endoribonuclease Cas2